VVKLHHDLFDRIAEFGALTRAARRAVRGKRRKPGAAAFMAGLETEVLNANCRPEPGVRAAIEIERATATVTIMCCAATSFAIFRRSTTRS
jgi:hypothetical protein